MMKPYISNGSVELLKWIGLILMTVDHANTFIFKGKYTLLFEAGRAVMPLFAFVLAYNLARPTLTVGVHKRIMQRLLIYGLCAMPFFIVINPNILGGWYPLNIMFTLLVSTACVFLMEKGGKANLLLFIVVLLFGGALVEYWYPAILFTVCSWQYCRSGKKQWLLAMLLMMFPIAVVNGSMSGAFALLLILIMSKIDVQLPKFKLFFYDYYPAHLAALLLVSFLLNPR
jgi:hypothetical protein